MSDATPMHLPMDERSEPEAGAIRNVPYETCNRKIDPDRMEIAGNSASETATANPSGASAGNEFQTGDPRENTSQNVASAATEGARKAEAASQTKDQDGEEAIEIVSVEAVDDENDAPKAAGGPIAQVETEAAGKNTMAAEAASEPSAPDSSPGKISSESNGKAAAREQAPNSHKDRRRRRRAMISAPVRVRGVNVTNGGPDEISTTIDVSRNGILFISTAGSYYKGMEVAVIFPYSDGPAAIHTEQSGRVVRIAEQAVGGTAVAVAFAAGGGEDMVDAAGRKLEPGAAAEAAQATQQPNGRPLILMMDPDAGVRTVLRAFLEMEGYQAIAVASASDARQVLDECVPALVIAEIEGDGLPEEGLPGYDLCAYIKETRRLKRIPVVLTTRSAYPSDYSNAHSLGAIVCMAKPYKQERLGHVVRLLAPLQAHKETPSAATCKPDPKRKACATPHAGAGHAPVTKQKYDENTNARRKFRFPTFR